LEPSVKEIKEKESWRELGLTDREYERIVELIGRDPNWTELGMFSVLWSEHCSYKHSRSLFHLFPTKGEHIIEGPGENAGVVDVGDGLAVVFKTESHNHPSAVEPYQGAATGVGGMLRDIFTMGARPIAVLNSLRFGPLTEERTKFLFDGVTKGVAGYGIPVGVPTVGGEIYFDPSYRGNPLVNVMAAGVVEHKNIARGHAGQPGNPVMVIGGPTGRDGIHGASFASAQLENKEENKSSVAIGDPHIGRKLIEATLELIQSEIIAGIQDMGAAGLTSSSCEMASRANCGIEMDLLKVPRREENMTPYEIMLSESQERMLVVPKKGFEQKVLEICRKWGVDAVVVGVVTDDGMLRLKEGEKVVAEVPAKALSTDGAPCYQPEKKRPGYLEERADMKVPENIPSDLGQVLLNLLQSPNIASKEWAYRRFVDPQQEPALLPPGQADAALVKISGTKKGLALSIGCNSRYCYLDPYKGAQIAVAEVARNISCVGAEPLAITDGMNFGNPENPEIYYQYDQAVRGISDACRALNTPVTGGNCSFYNESEGQAIYPTPVVGMIGLLADIDRKVGFGWMNPGDIIVLLGVNRNELGGSEYLALSGWVGGEPPTVDLELEKKVSGLCRELINKGLANSAHDTSEGGLAAALAESCIQGSLGAKITVSADFRADALLFGETQGRIIISCSPGQVSEVMELAHKKGVPVQLIGEVGGDQLTIDLENTPGANRRISLSVSEMTKAWREAIADLMAE
jgi:phosphoribosylformylglycinamidine synthase II